MLRGMLRGRVMIASCGGAQLERRRSCGGHEAARRRGGGAVGHEAGQRLGEGR